MSNLISLSQKCNFLRLFSSVCNVWKESKHGVFLVRIFLYLDWIWRFTEKISVFSPKNRKIRTRKNSVFGHFSFSENFEMKVAKFSEFSGFHSSFITGNFIATTTLRKKCPYSVLFWSKCGKMRTKITRNTDTFHAVPGSIET